jgi:hypothetical protein
MCPHDWQARDRFRGGDGWGCCLLRFLSTREVQTTMVQLCTTSARVPSRRSSSRIRSGTRFSLPIDASLVKPALYRLNLVTLLSYSACNLVTIVGLLHCEREVPIRFLVIGHLQLPRQHEE